MVMSLLDGCTNVCTHGQNSTWSWGPRFGAEPSGNLPALMYSKNDGNSDCFASLFGLSFPRDAYCTATGGVRTEYDERRS